MKAWLLKRWILIGGFMPLSEQKIQYKIIKYLESLGAYVVKVVKANRSGVADLLVCYKGKFIAVEVKSEFGVTSPLQKYHAELVHRAGGISIVAYSATDASEKIMQELLKTH